jgi:hypothetical protein
VETALASADLDGRRVLFIVPDGTRTMPLAQMVALFDRLLGPRVTALDYLIALGTHGAMSDAALTRLFGRRVAGGRMGRSLVFNHEWDRAETFVTLGVIPASEIASLSGGRLSCEVPSRSTGASSTTTTSSCAGRCSPTKWSGSRAARSTSSRASPAARSSTSRTGSGR